MSPLGDTPPDVQVRAALVRLEILDAFTLKDRRSAVKSLIDRLAKFNLSVCDLDGGSTAVNAALIGLAVVSNEASHAMDALHRAVEFIGRDGRVELLDVDYF